MTDRASEWVGAPHGERTPPVTLRKITLGRRARSHWLLVEGTSRRGIKTKRSPRHRRGGRANLRPAAARRVAGGTPSGVAARGAPHAGGGEVITRWWPLGRA